MALPSKILEQAQVELYGLKLLGFQRDLRKKIVQREKTFTTLDTALCRTAHTKKRRLYVRTAAETSRIEQTLKDRASQQHSSKHQDFLDTVLKHGNRFWCVAPPLLQSQWGETSPPLPCVVCVRSSSS